MSSDDYERELVNYLYDLRFAVQRAAASGSATENELPDVIGLRDGPRTHHLWAIEGKTSSDHHIYLPQEEVESLKDYADRGGLDALLAGRWKNDHDTGWNRWNDEYDVKAHYLFHVDDVYRTDSGKYRLTRPDHPKAPEPAFVVTSEGME